MSENKVYAAFETLNIPTYVPGKPNDLPLFFENRGHQGASGKVFPMPYVEDLSDKPVPKDYTVGVLENEYIRIETLPALGGKIRRAIDKTTGYDFIYHNPVIKPAMIGLAGPWVSGGIEFNWPSHHRPTTLAPVQAKIEEYPNGEKTVWMGECDPFMRTKGIVGVTVCPGRSYIKAKVRVYNRTPQPQSFMWWANLAVEINDNYRIIFPKDVEYVFDHDRRAVTAWPNPTGTFKTARPFDYKPGDTLEEIPTVKVPSSFMVPKGMTDMDFVSGYDEGVQCGLVTVANHHVSPGKKLFHWGVHQFGKNWCKNLTDNGSCYVELMTGVYTDNQPDFSWLAPYETKEFEQYWYPIAGIGKVKNATIDAAINVEPRDGGLFIGVQSTGVFENARLVIECKGETLFDQALNLDPKTPFTTTVPLGCFDADKYTARLTDAQGKLLVDVQPYERGHKPCPPLREPAPKPADVPSNEELFLQGRHLEQYKHPSIDPTDYYREALKRDPGDLRCNTALANLLYKDGRYEEALEHLDKAIARITLRNDNAYDSEPYFLKGLIMRRLGRNKEAYDLFFRCIWNYSHRTAGYYQLAELDCLKSDWTTALEHLNLSLQTNAVFTDALMLKAIVLRKLGQNEKAAILFAKVAALDPLEIRARYEMNGDLSDFPDDAFVDGAISCMNAGLNEEAAALLEKAPATEKILYYRGYLKEKNGCADCAEKLYRQGNEAFDNYHFFNRLDDIPVLTAAKKASPMAAYQLGNLLYDRRRYEEAATEWEAVRKQVPSFGPVYRNLARYYEDKCGDLLGARMLLEQALERMPNDDRIFTELMDNYIHANSEREERLALHNAHFELSQRRDECVRDRATLLALGGDYDAAIAALASHSFHTYEGGEGELTRLHAWIHVLKAHALQKEGRYAEAKEVYEQGLQMPPQYHEVKSYFTQDSHLYVGIAECCEALGDAEGAKAAYEKAAVNYGMLQPTTYYYAAALRKLGRHAEAQELCGQLVTEGKRLVNSSESSYFSIGIVVNDVKASLRQGYVYLAFGYLGLGRKQDAAEKIAELRKVDRTSFDAYLFEQLA